MKKILYLLFFIPLCVYSKTDKDSITAAKIINIEQRLSNIESINIEHKIDFIDKRLEQNENLTEKSFNSISTQLSVSEVFVGSVSVILTVSGIFLGWYINKKRKQVELISQQVEQLKSDNEELLKKATQAKNEVEQINSDINNNISEVYKKIKREETVHLLNRLVNVPQDISNVCELLVSRELEKEDFDTLKRAYLKLDLYKDSSSFLNNPKNSYKALFFQHFFVQSIKDEEIKQDIIDFIPEGINCAFENDIENTTKEFSIFLQNEDLKQYSELISEYFKGLSQSIYKDYKRVYEVFFENINNRNKQFELFDIVNSIKETRIAKIEYGNILKSNFSDIELADNEKLTFVELKKLKEEEIDKIGNEIITKNEKITQLKEQLAKPNLSENRKTQLEKEIDDIQKDIDEFNKKIEVLNLA